MLTNALHGQVLGKIKKLPHESLLFIQFRIIFLINLVTHCKNIIITQLTVLRTYLIDLKTFSSLDDMLINVNMSNCKYLKYMNVL